jgi:hypothetical protein
MRKKGIDASGLVAARLERTHYHGLGDGTHQPTRTGGNGTMPDPLPKPPGRPPGEPIIIKHPPPPPEVPEVDGSLDEEDDPEVKRPPEIVPEQPPPPAPWERADRLSDRAPAAAR